MSIKNKLFPTVSAETHPRRKVGGGEGDNGPLYHLSRNSCLLGHIHLYPNLFSIFSHSISADKLPHIQPLHSRCSGTLTLSSRSLPRPRSFPCQLPVPFRPVPAPLPARLTPVRMSGSVHHHGRHRARLTAEHAPAPLHGTAPPHDAARPAGHGRLAAGSRC